MTGNASPDESDADHDVARFLRDWAELWSQELHAQAKDPAAPSLALLAGVAKGAMAPDLAAALETWRTAMVAWAELTGVAPAAGAGDRTAAPRAKAAAAASDPRDAALEYLARRVDELEARLAKLEAPRRRRG